MAKKSEKNAQQLSDDSFEFLKRLVEEPSPSGFEQPAQRIFRERVTEYADDVASDVIGNSWGIVNGSDPDAPRVMLAGHCDEIGFIVRHVDKEGFLYLGTVGGHDRTIFPGQRLNIHTKKGIVRGVFGRKPVHMMEEAERSKVGKVHEFFIDIGAKNQEEALSMVSLGDVATYSVGLERLAGNLVTSRAFDDKMGAFLVAEVLRLLTQGDKAHSTVYGVSTVQEEIGLRGATTSSYHIDPTVGLALEVTFATDHPEMDKRQLGEFKLGGGPVIAVGANINFRVYEQLVAAAEAEGIPYQVAAIPGGTGTDANVMQLNRAGCATGLVSVALRYMHTPVEVLSLTDLESTARLIAAFVRRLDAKTDFIPS